MDASVPQTDRELLLKLNGEIEKLAFSITNFSQTLKEIEEKKIAGLDVRISAIEKVWTQFSGAWKFVLFIWTILTATGIVGLVRYFIVK
jgi:hypothetical protein